MVDRGCDRCERPAILRLLKCPNKYCPQRMVELIKELAAYDCIRIVVDDDSERIG